MGTPQPLRPELASVCRFLALKRAGRVEQVPPRAGVLAQLASRQGPQ
jgi:hypothetical protein